MSETLMQRLVRIQSQLKAPKNQRNDFGRYNYRSAEDILEAVKPLLAQENILQTITDEAVVIEGWHYIVSTVTLFDALNNESPILVQAYAREEETKKGMDASQITGSASSYARKYALNGMYAIDDTKDADTDEYQSAQQQPKPTATNAKQAKKKVQPKKSEAHKAIEAAFNLAVVKNNGDEKAAAVMMQMLMKEKFPGKTSKDLTEEEAKALLKATQER